MTEEQERLVLENLKLVPYILRRYPKSEQTKLYREDLLSEGYVGLIKAAQAYEAERGLRFSTFAYRCIQNQMSHYLRQLNKFSGKEHLLSAPVFQDSDRFGYEEILPDETDYAGIIAEKVDAQAVALSEREVKILKSRLRGYTQTEIAVELGIKQSYVSRLLKNIKTKLSGQPAKEKTE